MTTFIKNIFKHTPDDWLIDRFEDYVDFQEGPGLRRWQFADCGIPFLNIRCIKKNGDIDEGNLQYLREEDNEKYKHFLLKEGDTVLSSSGSLGRMAVIKKKHLPIMLNTSIIKLKSKNIDRLNDDYMRWFAKSDYFSQQFLQESQGSAQVNFGPTHLKKMYILLPPLKEQEKIADILSTADEKIDTIELQIQKAETLKKGLLQKLLSEGIGHSEFKDSELGKIPESWEVVELAKITTILLSNVDKKSKEDEQKVKLCNYMDVYNNQYITNDLVYMEATAKDNQIEKFQLQINDVIITKDSETKDDIAIPAVVKETFENLICGYHLAVLRPKEDILYGVYLMKAIQSVNVHKHFEKLANGITRFGLTSSAINQALIPLPPIEEQKQIAKILSTADEKLEVLRAKKEKYETLKKGLFQKLLSGEIRV